MSEEIRNFSRDTDAAVRLYLQHWIFKFETGFLLHPSIATSHSSDLMVLDVGCGTGLWLIDLAALLPDARLHGFDLSTAHFPPQDDLPMNVKLWQQDALQPVPTDLIGQYDIVHIARFHMYIGDDSLSLAIHNLMKLLKPGGHLQWDELDAPGMHAAHQHQPRQYPAFEKMQQQASSWMKTQRSTSMSLDALPEALEYHGLRRLQYKRWEVGKFMSKPWTDMQLIANRDYSENVIIPKLEQTGAAPKVIADVRSLRQEVEAEVVQQGLRILMDMLYVVAQKPE